MNKDIHGGKKRILYLIDQKETHCKIDMILMFLLQSY